ncbi:MAG: TonB-dependent receptor [Marinoscillum sp.]
MKTNLRKILIGMSKLAIYGMVFCQCLNMVLANETSAQRKYLEEISINIQVQGTEITLLQLIEKMEESSNFKFAYSKEDIEGKMLTITSGKRNMRSLLNEISIQGNFRIKRVNESISLTSVRPKDLPKVSDEVTQTISGTVTDENGEPLPGATVIEKGTTNGSITDVDGKFSLNVSEGATLLVSFVGYKQEEVAVGNLTEFLISLEPDTESLEEVVVIGYGSVKKEDLTGSVASIDSKTITATTITDAAGALQGRVPGVNIEKNVGRPGSGFNITVRGMSSLRDNGNSPLFVIDGIPTTSGLTDLNPNDIQKIDVLKDASATAIYGSRGANGVVIVTTKRGQEGKFTIQYDANYGVRTPTNLPDMMNGEEYVAWKTYLDPDFFNAEEQTVIDRGGYTDWIDLTLRNGMQFSNTVTASGGDAKGTFALSIGQLKEEGTVPGQDFNRYNMRLNINRNFAEKWQAGGNLYLSSSVQNEGSFETLRSAYRMPPVADPYDDNGELEFIPWRADYLSNPLLEFTEDGEWRENRRYRIFGNVYLQVEPIEGLTLRSQLSPQIIYRREGEYYGINAKNGGRQVMENTSANYARTDFFAYVLDNQVGYQKEVGQHDFNLNVIQSIQFEQWEEGRQSARNFPYNSKWYNMDAAEDITTSSTDYSQRSLASFTGRLQYSYQDRYLFTTTGRYDGSSRLSEGNKWAFFPSVAVGWKLSEEGFMRGVQQVDNLKLRLSYGVTGNDAVDIYGTQSNTSQRYYDFDGVVSPSFYKNRLANTDLTWERTHEINFGLDYGFFNYRIGGSIDVYRRDAKDLIMERKLPATSGWEDVWDNVGWVRNTGIELGLNTLNVQTNNFFWTTDIIFDRNKNEIVELFGEKKDDIGSRWFIGEPILVNYDYEFDGIWQSDEADLAAEYGQTPGQVRVKDLDDNRVIDADDRKIIGQRTPKWSGSITNTFNYKNWDFSVYVYTRQGQQLYSSFVSGFMALEGNYKNLAVDYWTEENPSNKYPEPGNKGQYFNSMRYQDVSFVRVGNISLGYTFPKEWMSKLNVSNLRLYCTAMNPMVFTQYPGYDPEWATQNTWGEATSYATYLMGINLEF